MRSFLRNVPEEQSAQEVALGSAPRVLDSPRPKTPLPEIMLSDRPLRNISRDALDALAAQNDPPRLFVQAGRLVRVRKDEKNRPMIDPITEASLAGRIIGRFFSSVSRTGGHKMEKLLLKPTEAADVLGIGRSKIYEMLRSGEVPSIRLGSVLRVPVDKLREWLAERTEGK